MLKSKLIRYLVVMWWGCALLPSYAQETNNGIGQTIQVSTRFHSLVGKPSWLVIIRDLDHNQNIPYVFDIKKGENFWVLYTYGRHYLITVSELQISTYQSRYNTFRRYKVKNFCHLESNGRIQRGTSMYITINGDLTINRDTYSCHVSSYADPSFTVVN